jgi:hypothetical protein
LEVFVCKFDLSANKPEWTQLLPRKINMYYPGVYDLVVRGYNNTVSLSYYEHEKNSNLNNQNYELDTYKLLRKPNNKKFISYTIFSNGEVVKNAQQKIDDEFMFPWLNQKTEIGNNFFFVKKNFLPIHYLYRN